MIELDKLFQTWSGAAAQEIKQLPISGSNRQYFRLSGHGKSAIGVFNDDTKENNAFVSFAEHFTKAKLNTPKIYLADLENNVYLQEDLGDLSLYKILNQKNESGFDSELEDWYKKSIAQLLKLQIEGSKKFDFGKCYPRDKFDAQSIQWDLNYFKYCFLKLADIKFDEQLLENDFNTLSNHLTNIPANHFMHRDFQSRNLMIDKDDVFIIDFQGGRKGPLQYDLVSLLFQAKANIPFEKRAALLEYYLDQLIDISQDKKIDRNKFKQDYYAIAFVRTMQVLGAYGFRGLFEKKAHFLQSIPFAINNLEWLINNAAIDLKIPTLEKVWSQILAHKQFRNLSYNPKDKLTVTISSFSYRRGIPNDLSGNGGGFVFDCRSIHNPGRYEPYKKLTGRDEPVKEFLQSESKIENYLNPVFAMVDTAVQTYIDRNFQHLMVSFGCTGGQHRSVYSCDSLAKHLSEKFDIEIKINHIEQELKNWING